MVSMHGKKIKEIDVKRDRETERFGALCSKAMMSVAEMMSLINKKIWEEVNAKSGYSLASKFSGHQMAKSTKFDQ